MHFNNNNFKKFKKLCDFCDVLLFKPNNSSFNSFQTSSNLVFLKIKNQNQNFSNKLDHPNNIL